MLESRIPQMHHYILIAHPLLYLLLLSLVISTILCNAVECNFTNYLGSHNPSSHQCFPPSLSSVTLRQHIYFGPHRTSLMRQLWTLLSRLHLAVFTFSSIVLPQDLHSLSTLFVFLSLSVFPCLFVAALTTKHFPFGIFCNPSL